MATKLSPAQQTVLDELKKPGVRAVFVNGYDAHWFLSSTFKRCTLQIEWLVAHGYLVITTPKWNSTLATLKKGGGDA